MILFHFFIFFFFFCISSSSVFWSFFFFFQAEDGIRDLIVTGVQTCALPISILKRRCLRWFHEDVGSRARRRATFPEKTCARFRPERASLRTRAPVDQGEIGRASCRERV